MMSAKLAEEHRQLQELVAKFVDRELMPLEPRINMASKTQRMVLAGAEIGARIASLEAGFASLKAIAGTGGRLPIAPRQHRLKSRLTNRRVETLKLPGFYADGDNLYLDFKEPLAKNWVFRYKRAGRACDHALGP